jgi:uncharacterized membrane protein
MIVSLFIISFLRGDGSGTMTGIIKCNSIDWFLFALLLGIAVALTIIAMVILSKEIKEKKEVGYEF